MKIYILILSVIVLFNNLQGQDSTSPSFILDTITVSSGKYEKNINELSYPAAVVQIEKINKSTSQSISDLLQNESGISLLRDGVWGTEVSIRGLSRNNVVTLIDGNRIETSTDVSARLSMIDINDIDRVEVIKGAVSTLYGTGATGGVINVISKRDSYADNFFLRGRLTNGFNSVNSGFLSGVNLSAGSQHWTARLSGSYRKAGDIKTPSGTLSNSQYEDNSFSGAFSIKPFSNQEVILNYQQFNAFDVGIPGAYPLFPNNAKVSYPEERRKMFSAGYNIANISTLLRKVSVKYYHQYMLRDVENIPYQVQTVPAANGQPARRVNVLEISPAAKHRTNGVQVQSDFTFGSSHYFILGFDYWNRRYNGERTRSQKIEVLSADGNSVVNTIYKTIGEKPLPDAYYSSTGLFAHDEIRLVDKKLNMTIGGRFDLININNKEAKNPLYEINNGVINNNPANQVTIWKAEEAENTSYTYNIGFVYFLSERNNISLNAARSFRSPSLEERYQYIDQGNIVRLGDPELNPEKGYSFDLGLRLSSSRLNTKTSIFYNYFNDLVSEVPGVYENRNALIKTNIGKASLYGFEFETRYIFTANLSVHNSISFVRGENLRDKTDLPQIAPINGILGISFSLPKFVGADLSAVYFAAQDKTAPGEIRTPGYVYFNLNLSSGSFKFGLLDLRLYAGIENIFDKEYRNHLSTYRGFITSEPGRNFYVKAGIGW